ncbi:MAG: APC family permease [Firmicutes bacterium]|nr:APC family permease [Bacillota bacterium]
MEQGKLKRQLGLLDLTLLGLGAIIGSGWLFGAVYAANDAGPASWISWVIGAIAVGLIGLVYAELGGALPRAGGIIRYPDYSHGPMVGYMMGFAALIAYSSVAGVEAEGMRQYLGAQWIPSLTQPNNALNLPTLSGWIVQFILLLLFFLLNYWSVNVFGKFNTWLTVLKFVVPTLAIIIFFTDFHASNFTVAGFNPGGFTGIEQAVATSGIIFSYLGFRQAVDFAGEAKNPQRTVPLAILLAIAIGAVVYILLQIVFIGAVPASALTHGWAKLTYSAPFADLAGVMGLAWFAQILFADAVISPSGTCNIYLSSTSRVIFAWARNGTFFKALGKIHKPTGVPRPALWLAFILAVLWTLPFPSWQGLVAVVSSATVMTYIIGPVSLSAFRQSATSMPRPFRLGGASVLAPLAFVIASLVIYWSGWSVDEDLLIAQVSVFVIYLILAAFKVMPTNQVGFGQQFKSAIWLVAYYIAMFFLSMYGTFGGTSKIPMWWDQIIVIVVSLIAYYWGVAARLEKATITDEETEEAIDGDVHSL